MKIRDIYGDTESSDRKSSKDFIKDFEGPISSICCIYIYGVSAREKNFYQRQKKYEI